MDIMRLKAINKRLEEISAEAIGIRERGLANDEDANLVRLTKELEWLKNETIYLGKLVEEKRISTKVKKFIRTIGRF